MYLFGKYDLKLNFLKTWMQRMLLNQDGKLVKDEAEESLLKLYDACF